MPLLRRVLCFEWLPWLQKTELPNDGNEESTGRLGERHAANYLRQQGLRLLFQGYRSWLGEIDIVALDASNRRRNVLVFVEVKTWSRRSEGGPSDAVDAEKQQRLTRLALEFMKSRRLLDCSARFDVVEVILDPLTIRHIPNAFEAVGNFQWFS